MFVLCKLSAHIYILKHRLESLINQKYKIINKIFLKINFINYEMTI